MREKKITEAEKILKEGLRSSAGTNRIKRALSVVYAEMGNYKLSDEYAPKVNNVKINPVTIANYNELWKIVKKRKVKLVCVQYPMRDIELLKSVFKEDNKIVFVDNARIFQEAVRKEGLGVYFRDMFGGDFGHCTKKGNRLLAENIANVILKDVFGK